jgi:tetratricopeptide (TPR) repeat protein
MPDPGSPRGVEGSVDAEKVVAIGGVNAQNVSIHVGDGARGGSTQAITPRLPERQRTFAGREAELADVHARLCLAAEVGITQQTAVHGHGGIGKTSLAVEYAWRHLAAYPGGVFCLACDTAADVPPLHELAPHLGIPAAETTDATAAAVRARLERGEPALLILDNVRGAEQWQSRAWREALPGGACRRLITTRAPRLADVPMYALQRLSTEDGVALLALYRPDALASREIVERVVEWFDGLAVGLTVVGIYLSVHPDLGWEPYFGSLERKGLAAVRGAEQEVADLYEQRVDAVFDDLLAALTPAERRAVEFAAVMPEEGIFAPWLVALLSEEEGLDLREPPGYEGRGADLVVRRLTTMQLLREQADGLLGLHRVLRRRAREVLAETGRLATHVARLGARGLARAAACAGVLTNPSLRQETLALVAVSEELEACGAVKTGAELASSLAVALLHLGEHRTARVLFSRFTTPQRLAEYAELEAAKLRANSAVLAFHAGSLHEALSQIEIAIEVERRHLLSDDRELARSYEIAANILHQLKRFEEAFAYINIAVQMEENAEGPNSARLADLLTTQALVLTRMGNSDTPQSLMERAIAIDRMHVDEDHPTLARRYSNYATILRSIGLYADARDRLENAIRIDEKHRPPFHPALAVRYNNLASLLSAIGEVEEARRLIELAIQIDSVSLPDHHPNMALRLSNAGHIELAAGNLARACEHFRRALEIGRKAFPDSHPDVQKYVNGVRRACGPDAIPPRADEAPN